MYNIVKSTLSNGVITYHKDDDQYFLHREDGPAMILPNGDYYYHWENKIHREDGPAAIYNGNPSWYIHGKYYSLEEWGKELNLSVEKIDSFKRQYHNYNVSYEMNLENKKQRQNERAFFDKTYDENGLLHSHNDQPAQRNKIGDHEWYYKGLLHREDGPARIDGISEYLTYYREGRIHRVNSPAVFNDSMHSYSYYVDGEIHREDGPAQIDPAYMQYRRWGRIHREDGPARIFFKQPITNIDDNVDSISNISECEWFLDNIKLTFDEWCQELNLSNEQKIFYAIKYSIS